MKKLLMVALAALIPLPIFAEQKKPTPTAVAKRQGEAKPAPAPTKDISSDSSRSNKSASDVEADRIFCGDHTDTPRCCRHNGGYWVSLGAGDPGGCNFYYYYYRVGQVNVKDKSFTAIGKGREVTFSGLKLQALPRVGDIIDINYTRSASGALEARAVKVSKSNTPKEGDVMLTPAPAAVKGPNSNMGIYQQNTDPLNAQMTGKVISRSANTFTVMSNGKKVTFSGAKLKALPKVGDIIDIGYTQTPSGPLEATTVKGSKSNSSE